MRHYLEYVRQRISFLGIDNLTGLVWLEDADCAATGMAWAAALSWVATLNSGECGLSDGSAEGDWRLPNVLESMSLVTQQYSSPAIPNTAGTGKMVAGDPFTNVQSNYWTSTEYFGNNGYGLWTSATYGYYWCGPFAEEARRPE